jgi:Tol biopolymer transport system component
MFTAKLSWTLRRACTWNIVIRVYFYEAAEAILGMRSLSQGTVAARFRWLSCATLFAAHCLLVATGSAHSQSLTSWLSTQKSVRLPQNASPNGDILYPPLSYDGRYLAFHSRASNLVPGDSTRTGNVFVQDLRTRRIQKLSVGVNDSEANGNSTYPSLAGRAPVVVFTSDASNLVPADDNGKSDVFVADITTGSVQLVSKASGGRSSNGRSYNYFPAITADGNKVVFNSDATNLVGETKGAGWNVYVFDRREGTVRLISKTTEGVPGNGASMHGVISGDGRFVAYHSRATNLVAGNTKGVAQVYLHDLTTGETTLISRGLDGQPGGGRSERASISFDGKRIAFSSDADNLVVGDTNRIEDVFVFDQQTRQVMRVSVGSGGAQMEPVTTALAVAMDRKSVISPDGKKVAFRSGGATTVANSDARQVEVFIHTIATKRTERLGWLPSGERLAGNSEHHALNFDGSVAAFTTLIPHTVGSEPSKRLQQAGALRTESAGGERPFSHGLIRYQRTGRTRFIVE